MTTIDGRCAACPNANIYRMVGACGNCSAKDLLMLFTADHRTKTLKCPLCGCDTVYASRLATPDEIPEAAVRP